MEKYINISKFIKAFAYLKYVPKIIYKIKNWPEFILRYSGIKKGGFECVFRNGTKIIVQDNRGAATIAVIFIKEDYGSVDDNSVIIDIGANIGVYAIFSSLDKNNKVYAFEPMTDNFEILKRNITLNNMEDKIIPFNLAVSGKKEKRDLYLGESPFHSLYSIKESPFNALYNLEVQVEQSYRQVDSLSLNDIFLENKVEECDMLKIDCEGAEFEILYNLKDEYFKRIKNIRMEYHNHKYKKDFNGKNLVEFLRVKGFKTVKFKKSSPYQGDLWLENTDNQP